MKTLLFGEKTIFLPKTSSTNNEAWRQLKERDIEEGTMVWTLNQTNGKGAGENKWESEAEKNLTVSFIVFPDFLEIESQFYLNMIVSIAFRETVADLTGSNHEVFLKWPNDIIVNGKKTGGILIENSIMGNSFKASIIGIGLNVNQTIFSHELTLATSLKQLTGEDIELSKIATELCSCMNKWYNVLRTYQFKKIHKTYMEHLYLNGKQATYKSNNKTFKAEIAGITEHGKLRLKTENGNVEEFAFKEVELLY